MYKKTEPAIWPKFPPESRERQAVYDYERSENRREWKWDERAFRIDETDALSETREPVSSVLPAGEDASLREREQLAERFAAENKTLILEFKGTPSTRRGAKQQLRSALAIKLREWGLLEEDDFRWLSDSSVDRRKRSA